MWCSFQHEYLDDTLRDSFLCGFHSENIQKHLLSEKDLTIASALERVQNLETAHRNTQVLKGHSPTLTLAKLSNHKPFRRSPGRGTHKLSGRSK